MPDHPLVSVVVPFFDSDEHLAACIDSLLAQEDLPGPAEILLVDNGSRDRSPEIAASYDQVIALNEPEPGAYAARNAGIRRARGSVIAFTDADCVADPNWLGSIGRGLEDDRVAILLGRCDYPREASPVLRWLAAYENAKTDYVLGHCAKAHHFAYNNNMAVRRSVFEEIGLFREWKRAADTELLHRLAAQCPDLNVRYRHDMRITHLEFLAARHRARRLALYTKTNSRIETFRELSFGQRFDVLRHLFLARIGRSLH